jgi:thioredoxin-related protein
MVSRRAFLRSSALGVALLPLPAPARAQPTLGDDGLYHEPWFLESLLELADDLDGAAAQGKRFAIMWELRGCPYCRNTHVINFAKPEIADFVKAHFDILQLNIIGAREVVDFDGVKLPEKRLAEKYGVRFTPTFQFFPERSAGLASREPRAREVTRAQGYLPPDDFLAMFKFVTERAYERGPLPDYLRGSDRSSPPPVR